MPILMLAAMIAAPAQTVSQPMPAQKVAVSSPDIQIRLMDAILDRNQVYQKDRHPEHARGQDLSARIAARITSKDAKYPDYAEPSIEPREFQAAIVRAITGR
jgi:hypothetical protein